MRTTAVRRTALAASATALALLVTACGGSDDSGSDSGKGDEGKAGSSASAAPAAKALTAAELEKVALVQADVEDGKMVTKLPAGDDIAADAVEVKGEACQPLAHIQAGVPVGSPAATVKRSWTGEPEKPAEGADLEESLTAGLDVDKVLITLASYENGAAEQVVKDVEAAVEKCAEGFAYTTDGESGEYVKAVRAEGPKGADESLTVALTMSAAGSEAPVNIVVARTGSTVAACSAINLAALAAGEEAPFPTQISDAQLAKLG